MRPTSVIVAMAACLLVAAPACSRLISGTARIGGDQPQAAITDDEFGIRAGLEDAPVQLEIYTEPQCSHCADLQADFGDQIAYYIGTGQLAVTYRPLTFLDQQPGGYSAHVATALFTAATPGGPEGGGTTPARAFQRFVEDLWAHQDTGGEGPSDDEMADMARASGIPRDRVDAIANGDSAVDVKAMDDTNFEFLFEIDSLNTGTPTVYDLNHDVKLDIYDDEWLSKLMES